MRKSKLLFIGSIIASSLITASVFASTPTDTMNKTRTQKQWTNSGMVQKTVAINAFKKNIVRTVTNISNGIQISEITTDSSTLSLLNKMFLKEQTKVSKKSNQLITITKTQISNGIQTTITSTDPATITKIQSNGNNLGKMELKKKFNKKGAIIKK